MRQSFASQVVLVLLLVRTVGAWITVSQARFGLPLRATGSSGDASLSPRDSTYAFGPVPRYQRHWHLRWGGVSVHAYASTGLRLIHCHVASARTLDELLTRISSVVQGHSRLWSACEDTRTITHV